MEKQRIYVMIDLSKFEDPSFGFEDPSFGFEDPSFGYEAGEFEALLQRLSGRATKVKASLERNLLQLDWGTDRPLRLIIEDEKVVSGLQKVIDNGPTMTIQVETESLVAPRRDASAAIFLLRG